jgi:hypothetical protein
VKIFEKMVDDKEDLSNAIALNSSMVNGARLIGPSIAGVLIAVTGEGVCFFLNALTGVSEIIFFHPAISSDISKLPNPSS